MNVIVKRFCWQDLRLCLNYNQDSPYLRIVLVDNLLKRKNKQKKKKRKERKQEIRDVLMKTTKKSKSEKCKVCSFCRDRI